MGIKEIYEEMSDEELLERFKNFKDYREDGKKAIIEELRKRNLVREEEIEKKLDGIKKYEEEKIKEDEKVKEKYKEIEGKNDYFEFPLIKEMFKFLPAKNPHLVAHFLLGSWIIFLISIIINLFSLFFETTDGTIIKIEKRKITYQYNLGGEKIISNKVTLMDPILEVDSYNLSIGDKIEVYYNPFFKNKSVLIRGIDIKNKFAAVIVYLSVCFMYILSYGRLRIKYLLIGFYALMIILIMPGFGIKIL